MFPPELVEEMGQCIHPVCVCAIVCVCIVCACVCIVCIVCVCVYSVCVCAIVLLLYTGMKHVRGILLYGPPGQLYTYTVPVI